MKPGEKVYIYDTSLIEQCDRHPVVKSRASRVHDLISSYGLLEHFTVIPSKMATKEHLRLFHSADYLDALETSTADEDAADEEYGLGYDCPKIPKLLEFCQRIAGATISAADALIAGAKVAVNWCGGWHHAQRDSAEGFCYVNDIVIGIQRLLQKDFQRVLYIDLDIHHGDGVENAFATTKRVFTLSFHQHEAGFFPGTGHELAAGFGAAKGFAANFPFREHISGENYRRHFEKIASAVVEKFQPSVLVVQCGGDVLAGDPLGGSNLTTRDLGDCLKHLATFSLPMMVLGGGGYNLPNTARYWTHLTGVLCGLELPQDLPDNEFFLDYGPTFDLHVEKRCLRDGNRAEDLEENCRRILQNLETLFG